ncbi:peptidase S24/S26A/S26B/S26C [Ampelomyces quisqualis]|uniref:Mitochondrial inner membrane protease subunit n=1 Tax=Ampelomyces quisqualis TaxID=50730 RepID=A0A6A5QE51_AMPQU|nr:peptidase S24/S26A/S26B/S26C [Ampelomyces quisqualis]
MPPKPRLRIPVKPAPAVRTRVAQSPNVNVPRTPPPPHNAQAPRTPWHQNPSLRRATRWGAYNVMGICSLLWLRDHYLDLTHVHGASMAPTLNPRTHETGEKDYIIILPYQQRQKQSSSPTESKSGIHRGDIVTFWKPRKPEQMGIKRVIAVEGDTVYPKSGYAVESGKEVRLGGVLDGLPEHDEDSVVSEERGKIIVPYGHIWVEGDNSKSSLDSRDNGPISKGLVLGKAVWVWRGWGRFERIGDKRSEKEKELGSRVVEGKAEIPALFLE